MCESEIGVIFEAALMLKSILAVRLRRSKISIDAAAQCDGV